MSNSETVARQLTIRLVPRLLGQARSLARARATSVNELVRSLLEAAVAQERARELARAYEVLGSADSESDVEPFLGAQAEVGRHE